MKRKNKDSLAFPGKVANGLEKDGSNQITGFSYEEAEGLTKREYFAGLAMQGILANATTHEFYRVNNNHLALQIISADAIKCADELLKQLEA